MPYFQIPIWSPHIITKDAAQVTVELKNDLAIKGTLHSVDQYLNIKLNDTKVINEAKYPHMVIPDARVTPDPTIVWREGQVLGGWIQAPK